MIEIIYENSKKERFPLLGERLKAVDGTFHKYKWERVASELSMGESLEEFKRGAVTYSIKLRVRGDLSERKEVLNRLRDSFEMDIFRKKSGRIYFGETYIEGWVVESYTHPSERAYWSDNDIVFYCPYPFWVEEKVKSFHKKSRNMKDNASFLDYKYDYPYDYSAPPVGSENWEINHYAESNFRLTIYGPCVDPRIAIEGHIYQVMETLEEEEYIIVDSRSRTIKKYLSNGTVQNIFQKRNKETSIFRKIQSGSLLFSWNGTFGFDMSVYIERSEPRWS